jgi:cytochrome b subunit of formate dehydrogenase
MNAGRGKCKLVARWFELAFAALLALALGGTASASAKECADCHSGQDQKAPVVGISGNSAHSSLGCGECHTGLKLVEGNVDKPHGERVRPVQCKTCHEDQSKTFAGSSHSGRMKEYFEKKGNAKPAQSCVACHATDPHSIAKVKDPVSPTSRTTVASTCLKCHDMAQPSVVNKYTESVHDTSVAAGKLRAAVCTDCHGSHAIDHSRLSNSTVYRTTIPQTCGKCHPAEFSEYMASFHWQSVGKGFREAPVCTDCHGEHTIRSRRDPQSSTWAGNVTKTCAHCHGSERLDTKFMITPGGVESLKDSFHGISSNIGDIRVANCSSCHGSHMILPRSDPRSFVNPANLGRTCGLCHPGAEQRFINAGIHAAAQAPPQWSVGWVRGFYLWLIALTIGGMLVHNLLDLRYKAMCGLPYHKHEILEPRFSLNERLQHALLALTFMLLAVSGFARTFPESPFNWPFQIFAESAGVRSWTHRVAAFAFIGLSVYHMAYLFLHSRGRQQFKALWPRLSDAQDAKNAAFKYVGLLSRSLELPHYCYHEKAEYWALACGSLVMAVTGAMLLLVDNSWAMLPLRVGDLVGTVHLWQAGLAALAIVVWRSYWVIFDPEYYPLNLSWLIGRPRPLARPPAGLDSATGAKEAPATKGEVWSMKHCSDRAI